MPDDGHVAEGGREGRHHNPTCYYEGSKTEAIKSVVVLVFSRIWLRILKVMSRVLGDICIFLFLFLFGFLN